MMAKTVFYFFALVAMFSAISTHALDIPSSQAERQLFLQNTNRNCRRQVAACQVSNPVEKVPFPKWMAFLQVSEEGENDAIDAIRKLLNFAESFNVDTVLDGMRSFLLSNEKVGGVLSVVTGLLKASQDIVSAITSGDIFGSVRSVIDLAEATTGVFGAATDAVTLVVKGTMAFVEGIATASRSASESLVDVLQYTLSSVVELFMGMFRVSISLFKDDGSMVSKACSSDLMSCEYKAFAMKAFPSMVTAAFVAAGEE